MLQKDFFLKQINEFFEALSKIILNIKNNRLGEAEVILNQHLDELMIEQFLNGEEVIDFDIIKFQAQLLFLKYSIGKQKNIDDESLKEQCLKLLNYVIQLRPNEYDVQLNEMLSNLKD